METKEIPVYHGYELHALTIFQTILSELTEEVDRLMEKSPDDFFNHPKYKLFEAVLTNILDNVPQNPDHNSFRQGLTLGPKCKSWRRVKKKNLPPRYRLFFQFNSNAPKTIIYAWLNDDSTQRKAGSKTDVYTVFKKMLDNGTIPNSWNELTNEANPLKQPS